MRRKKTGVLQFPGSNCDRDVFKALKGCRPEFIPHKDRFQVRDYKGFILPGGFSYGDYLRSGALAARSPAMQDIKAAAAKGFPVLGICNGFQILCEAGILEGALLPNIHRRFIDKDIRLLPKTASGFWGVSEPVLLPIAHGEGRYFTDRENLKKLWGEGRVWLVYEDCPNGSLDNIAGVKGGDNVAGLMPHPERAAASWMGSVDGLSFFKGLKES